MTTSTPIAARVGRVLEVALYVVGGSLVVGMMLYVVANALSRTALRTPFPASLEVVQFLMMPALACLGFIAATVAHRHVVAEIIFDRFPAVGRKWLVFSNSVLCVLTLGVLVWFTWDHAMFAVERDFKAGFTDIPSWPLYVAIPIALLLSAALFAHDAWLEAREAAEGVKITSTSRMNDLTEEQQALLDQARAAGEVL